MTTPTHPTDLPTCAGFVLDILQAFRDNDFSEQRTESAKRALHAYALAAIAADRQSASRATLDELHAAIMNIPAKRLLVGREGLAYAEGHRDARHAAAELALTANQAAEAPPVAVEATKAVAPSLDKLMDAFITSEMRGMDKHYALIFKYQTHEALHAAEDQLHAYCIANKEPK